MLLNVGWHGHIIHVLRDKCDQIQLITISGLEFISINMFFFNRYDTCMVKSSKNLRHKFYNYVTVLCGKV